MTHTQAEKRRQARTVVKIGIVFYLAPLVVFAIFANMSGDHQGSITNTYATISGVLLALYSLLEKKKRLVVVLGLLVSILASLSSTIASYDYGQFSTIFGVTQTIPLGKGLFIGASAIFAGTTYLFASSIEMEKFQTKRDEGQKAKE